MKRVRKILPAIIVLIGLAFSLTGCYESRYYHHYNHHTRGWYNHHHRQPPAGVNFEIDVRNW